MKAETALEVAERTNRKPLLTPESLPRISFPPLSLHIIGTDEFTVNDVIYDVSKSVFTIQTHARRFKTNLRGGP